MLSRLGERRALTQAGVEGDSLEGDAESAPGPSAPEPNGGIWKLPLGASGIVFGDIGASPLYAFRESFVGHHRLPLDGFHVISVLSLLIWALILVVTPLG